MKVNDQLRRAHIFLSENAVRQNSWTRTLCSLMFDLILLAGLVWHVMITIEDWSYWQQAPVPFNIFLLVQYVLLASCIRLPVTTLLKQQTITKVTLLLGLILLINTTIGTFWFFELTDAKRRHETAKEKTSADPSTSATTVAASGSSFVLSEDYLAHGIILILIPFSILLFLVILLVKVICFFFADRKGRGGQSRKSNRLNNYGQFNDDETLDQETESVIGVYFKIMDRVQYRTVSPEEANDAHPFAYMAEQKQCRLCLQYFKQEEWVMKIPMCEHILHPHCLKKWLIDFQKCPVCESNIIKLPGQHDRAKSLESGQGAIELGDAPGVREFHEANEGRNVMAQGYVSPRSQRQNQVLFQNNKNEAGQGEQQIEEEQQ